MSSSWSALGRTLEQYFDEAAPVSPDCKAQRNRLQITFSDWPHARADNRGEDWTRFLQILRVPDGLEPVVANLRRAGTLNGYWNAFLLAGNPKLGLDETWTKYPSKHRQHARRGVGECRAISSTITSRTPQRRRFGTYWSPI